MASKDGQKFVYVLQQSVIPPNQFSRNSLFAKNTYTEFHENSRDGLVTDTRFLIDGETGRLTYEGTGRRIYRSSLHVMRCFRGVLSTKCSMPYLEVSHSDEVMTH